MFPRPTELLLIGCLKESIWTPRSKSNTLTPRTNSQTYWPREISRVMNGTIFCVCSTLAISVPSTASKRCRKEHKKMQMNKESQLNQSRWWIRQAVFSSAEIWWIVENKNGETCIEQVGHRWWCGLWHRRRIGPFSKITIILEQSEWSIAKDAEPFSRRFNARHW